MLFTQFSLEDAKKVWYREAFEDGEESGQARGRSLAVIEKICRKLQKGKTPETIAEELEESLESVEKICAAIDKCGPDADVKSIYEQLQNIE